MRTSVASQDSFSVQVVRIRLAATDMILWYQERIKVCFGRYNGRQVVFESKVSLLCLEIVLNNALDGTQGMLGTMMEIHADA